MANNFSTTIKVIGDDADVAEVMAFVEETDFDFNKIIPMPEELDQKDNASILKELHWRYENWGTRNEAIWIEIDGNEMYYETFNGAAIPILEHISSLFPKVRIEFSYLDRVNLQGYDGEIQAGDELWTKYRDYYPHDDEIDKADKGPITIINLNQPSSQELMDDDLPF